MSRLLLSGLLLVVTTVYVTANCDSRLYFCDSANRQVQTRREALPESELDTSFEKEMQASKVKAIKMQLARHRAMARFLAKGNKLLKEKINKSRAKTDMVN